MKPPTHIVHVEWLDAVAEEGDSTSPTGKPYPRETCGYLLSETDEGVTIAHTWDAPDRSVEGKTCIPRGMIKRLLRWKVRR